MDSFHAKIAWGVPISQQQLKANNDGTVEAVYTYTRKLNTLSKKFLKGKYL